MVADHGKTENHHLEVHAEMRPHLKVYTDDHGYPFACVPDEWMWDLVDYLSLHRLNLSYHFEGGGFRVSFRCKTAAAAQRLLENWAHMGAAEFEYRGDGETCGCDLCTK